MGSINHYDDTSTARFVTFSCHYNYKLFKTKIVKDIFVKHLILSRKKHNFKLFAYVIMPNHVHLVLLPPAGSKLSNIIRELKSLSAQEIISYWKTLDLQIFDRLKVVRGGKEMFAFWQRKYYDYNCRTKEKTLEKINYCHNNPFVKGLVTKPEDWEWSSCRWYHGLEDILIKMDTME